MHISDAIIFSNKFGQVCINHSASSSFVFYVVILAVIALSYCLGEPEQNVFDEFFRLLGLKIGS